MDATSSLTIFQGLAVSRYELIAKIARYVVLATTVQLAAISLVLFTRRCYGGFAESPNSWTLLATTVTLVTIGALLRLGWHRERTGRSVLADRWVLAGPTVSLLLLAGSVSLPGSPVWALVVLWLAVLVEEGLCWYAGIRTGGTWFRRPRESSRQRVSVQAPPPESVVQPAIGQSDQPLAEHVSQMLMRGHEEDGSDVLYGTLRSEFSPGQRAISLHVAICPPMDAVPDFNAEQVDGAPLSIKAAQVLPYGARLDLRLNTSSRQKQAATIRFVARCVPSE